MAKVWKLPVPDTAQIQRLSRALGVPAVVAHLLASRGLTDPEQARSFLSPSLRSLHDPTLLPGVCEAAERIVRAVRAGRRIVIYGDYDADGVTGTAILVQCLRLTGAQVRFYVPHRIEEGYGLNTTALETIRRDMNGDLVVTVDCGITSRAEVQAARRLGLELIVTDHHQFGQELPEADCLVHPRLPGSSYPFGELSGSGVAMKLAWQVARCWEATERVSERYRSFLLQAVALAALGTVADVVPLRDENRVLVRYGLGGLQSDPPLGLRELMKVASMRDGESVTAEKVAFQLAPRINAAGRLGQATLAVELLLTASPQRACELAQYLHTQNQQRQSIERRILREANQLISAQHDLEQDRAIVVGKVGWHAGVIGIVAARLVERYWRPVMLVALGDQTGQGSGRSIPGIDLYQALQCCADTLTAFGGHAMAAGVRMERSHLDGFRRRFCEAVRQQAERLGQECLAERLEIDAEVSLADLNWRLVRCLEQLGPFGCGNQRPVLMASQVQLTGPPQQIGGGQRHLAFRVRQNGTVFRAVAFDMGERHEELTPGEPYDLAFTPQINTYQGYSYVDLHIKDFRPYRHGPHS